MNKKYVIFFLPAIENIHNMNVLLDVTNKILVVIHVQCTQYQYIQVHSITMNKVVIFLFVSLLVYKFLYQIITYKLQDQFASNLDWEVGRIMKMFCWFKKFKLSRPSFLKIDFRQSFVSNDKFEQYPLYQDIISITNQLNWV